MVPGWSKVPPWKPGTRDIETSLLRAWLCLVEMRICGSCGARLNRIFAILSVWDRARHRGRSKTSCNYFRPNDYIELCLFEGGFLID